MSFREIVQDDIYRLRGLPQNHFDTIIDIGANAGLFTITTRILFPKAKIIALEPWNKTFEELKHRTRDLNIECINKAIGDGEDQWLRPTNNSEAASVHKTIQFGGPIQVQTITLNSLFKKTKGKILCKCDCEGGEGLFVGQEELIRRCNQFSAEYHWRGLLPHNYNKEFWIEWVSKFSDTHNIEYTQECGGRMVVVMKKNATL